MTRGIRTLVSCTIFPTMFVGSIAWACWALDRGWTSDPIILVAFVASVAVIVWLERAFPYRQEWNQRDADFGADAAYLPIMLVIGGLVSTGAAMAGVVVAGWLSRTIGIGLWPVDWPLLAQFALACVVAEFFDYWGHRVMHEHAWLWRLHATHHSALRVYWLNGFRQHPLELVFRGTIGVLPLGVLGAGESLMVLVAVLNMVVSLFQHANFDFRLGPLRWIFSVGELHYWHHSRTVEEANSNYGSNFIFWDAVFGTRFLPADRTPPTNVGIDGLGAFPQTLGAQLLSPFRWSTILADSARRA